MPQSQPAPDVIAAFSNSQHGLAYYSNLRKKIDTENALLNANRALFVSQYGENRANNEINRLTDLFNTRAAQLTTGSSARNYYIVTNAVSSRTAFNTNYMRAYEDYNNIITGPNNQNWDQLVAAATNIQVAAWEAGANQGIGVQLFAYYDGLFLGVVQQLVNDHINNEKHFNNLIPGLVATQNTAGAVHNAYVALAEGYRNLPIYSGRVDAGNQSAASFGIADYEPLVAANRAVLMTGGLVGAVGMAQSGYGNNITNAVVAVVVEAAKENNADIAAASQNLQNRLHTIARARIAANDTANNAYKEALNTVANKAEVHFATRNESNPLTTTENSLKTAYQAWNQNDTSRNNAALQANVSNTAKVLVAAQNSELRSAIRSMYRVELATVAQSITADSDFTDEEHAFTDSLNSLGTQLAYKGSEGSRFAAAALRGVQQSINKLHVQQALTAGAFAQFNTAFSATANAGRRSGNQTGSLAAAFQSYLCTAVAVCRSNLGNAKRYSRC